MQSVIDELQSSQVYAQLLQLAAKAVNESDSLSAARLVVEECNTTEEALIKRLLRAKTTAASYEQAKASVRNAKSKWDTLRRALLLLPPRTNAAVEEEKDAEEVTVVCMFFLILLSSLKPLNVK